MKLFLIFKILILEESCSMHGAVIGLFLDIFPYVLLKEILNHSCKIAVENIWMNFAHRMYGTAYCNAHTIIIIIIYFNTLKGCGLLKCHNNTIFKIIFENCLELLFEFKNIFHYGLRDSQLPSWQKNIRSYL